jgi:hypothetical protein
MRNFSIIKAIYKGDFTLELLFSDNTSKIVDFKAFLQSHPQFGKYNKETNFKKFRIENGNVVWGKDWDLIFPINQLLNGNII